MNLLVNMLYLRELSVKLPTRISGEKCGLEI